MRSLADGIFAWRSLAGVFSVTLFFSGGDFDVRKATISY